MDNIKITVGSKQYNCKVFTSEEEKKKGLMGVQNLPEDEGALFVWDNEDTRQMWMKNTPIPLDMIAINEEDEVVKVYTATPFDETLIPFNNTKYILEVNKNSGIQVGDDFEIESSDDDTKYVMKVLGSDGEAQFLLQGGERIFSRISTKQMIKWAKKAEANKSQPDIFNKMCIRLGKRCFRELYDQDHRDAEYVTLPDKS